MSDDYVMVRMRRGDWADICRSRFGDAIDAWLVDVSVPECVTYFREYYSADGVASCRERMADYVSAADCLEWLATAPLAALQTDERCCECGNLKESARDK